LQRVSRHTSSPAPLALTQQSGSAANTQRRSR
jgi:hypothetical protein